MARDNSPKERQLEHLMRKLNNRASYDRILIVSEGSKTEPNYFSEIRATYRLRTANIVVQHSELGTEPIQVVKYAKELFESGDRHKNIQRRAFEQIYAVFDRDDHSTYFDALNLVTLLDGRLRNDNKQNVSLVGTGMKSNPGVAAKMFKTLADNGINISMISTSTIRTSVVIEGERLQDALRCLHTAFGLDSDEVFQETQLSGKELAAKAAKGR
ncbi:MAG: ACT domain-containing protein [Actinobacteria bacterium]|nr:ACT domain-containing protein [Actinomycetota bacterium]